MLDHQLSENGSTLSDPSAPVKSGATYILTLPPPVDATPKGENLPLNILFEDDHIIAINKPVGLVVHPAPGSLTGTLVNALIAHCGESLTGIGGVLRPGIVHRLDKDTSGVMIAAKTAVAHANLTSMFAAHDLDRRYQALVWGTEIDRDGTVDAPLGRSNFDRKKQAVTSKAAMPSPTGTHCAVFRLLQHCWNVSWRPAAPIKSAFIWRISGDPSLAIHYMAGRRVPDKCPMSPPARVLPNYAVSGGKRCMPRIWALPIR